MGTWFAVIANILKEKKKYNAAVLCSRVTFMHFINRKRMCITVDNFSGQTEKNVCLWIISFIFQGFL